MTLFDPEAAAGAGPPESETVPVPAPAGIRIRMRLAYDGSGFHGFAVQPQVTTVAGSLAQALQTVVGHPVDIVCAGRTDAGVHASGQVVHFDIDPERARPGACPDGRPDPAAIRRACNRMLAPAVVIRTCEPAPPGFDARRSALWRRYRYLVLNREDPDPFLARTTWHVDEPLDLRCMQLACDPLYGQHDFRAFCRARPDGGGSTERRILRAEWSAPHARPRGTGTDPVDPDPVPAPPTSIFADPGPLSFPDSEILAFDVVASAFCHQMVRSLVGTMVDIGRGRIPAGDMAWILRSGQRSLAGVVAPPQGLCLEEVGYPE